MVKELTGMDYSNASLLDEGTSAAEAVNMVYGTHNGKRNKVFVSNSIYPQTLDVMRTRSHGNGIELVFGDVSDFPWADAEQYCGAIFQNPDNVGHLQDYSSFISKLKESKVRSIVIADIMSLPITKSPGEMGADIAVGSVQRFGIPMGNGGPHPGYMACKDEYKRKMPGRIIGISRDAHGEPAYRMSLQTREQHIRRDKATSNICTAQALLATMTSFYGVWHGPEGLRKIATRIRFRAQVLADDLKQMGIKITSHPENFFDTVTIDCKASGFSSADFVLAEFHKIGINLRKIDVNTVGISMNEAVTIDDLSKITEHFAFIKEKKESQADKYLSPQHYEDIRYRLLPNNLRRTSNFMEQQIFNQNFSETEMMRYIHRLGDKDYGLTHGMIPLGSCTMKLNSAIAMLPITFPGFANIHPFAPKDQVPGYMAMIKELDE